MSAVDAPPGIAFAGLSAGEFMCRRGPRRLAGRVFTLVLLTSATATVLATRRVPGQTSELILAVALMCASVAAVGYAIRRARLRIDADGVRWGWSDLGFRVTRDELVSVDVYRDAIAVVQRRGSTWFVSARDWDRFERLPGALRRAGLPAALRGDRRAPFRARMQSYGTVLDILLLVDAIASVFALGVAVGL